MTNMTRSFRLLTVAALLTGTALMAACGSPDKVSKTTTTEQTTTTAMPPPVTSSTTTTTIQKTQP